MNFFNRQFFVLLLLMCCHWSNAATLVAPPPVDNENEGVTFDVHALTGVTVTGLSTMMKVGPARTASIYGRVGTHVSFESSPAAWTLLGSVALPVLAADSVVALAIPLAVTIPANGSYAFLVFASDLRGGPTVGYRNALTPVGSVNVADAALEILVGTGKRAPFATGSIFTPRAFVGSLTYFLGSAEPTVVPTLGEYSLMLLGSMVAAFGLRAVRQRG
jgi:IPTL-CTERM motif